MEKNMKKLLIIQPLIASYRKDFFNDISKYFNKTVIFANLNTSNGFKSDVEGDFEKIDTPILGKREKMYYQKGIITSILKDRPTIIYLTADFRAVHYYLILLLAKLLKIPTFAHGQGLYDKPNPHFIYKILFKFTVGLSSQYICYTKSVYDSLVSIGISKDKLSIMDNMIINHYPIEPQEKKELKNKIFYVGRLRDGSNLNLLFDAMKTLKEDSIEVSLIIVGDGEKREEYEDYVKELDVDVNFLGVIYDDKIISELSKDCKIGVYPGDAGLSIVHYMSLSLVPIVHDQLDKHMGPEPSYIEDGVNGLLFNREDSKSLANSIKVVLNDDKIREEIAKNAYKSYIQLSKPNMAEKFINIISPFVNKENSNV
jgi:glycosyltransferase involved in cell wall biosynthesis